MSEYPIEGLMNTAMNSIKEMVDVNTIIGEPIQTSNNIVIIPVSKVNFGFASGGSEFKGKTLKDNKNKEEENNNEKNRMPFGGGSGAGVSISPIAFIVVQQSGVKLLPVEHSSALDKLLDLVPDLVDKVNYILDKQVKKFENTNANIKENIMMNETITKKPTSNRNKNSSQTSTTTTTSKIIKNEVSPYDIEYDETSDM